MRINFKLTTYYLIYKMQNDDAPSILIATQKLIYAIDRGDCSSAKEAIQEGADVNCRIVKMTEGLKIAEDSDVKLFMKSQLRSSCYGLFDQEFEIDYEVPMADTTTLLNILARNEIKDKSNVIPLAELLMENGAELGAIDYASYWVEWGKSAENYFQNTPLLNAIASDNLPFALIYMKFLAKMPENNRQEILDYKDKFCAGFHTALEFAIRRGFSQLATIMIRLGANPNPQPFIFSYAGKTPLHMACMLFGQSKTKTGWNTMLGSDLELIITLLEYQADYCLTVSTDICDGVDDSHFLKIPKWKKSEIAAFDYIDLSVVEDQRRSVDILHLCDAPAFSPKTKGQIKHPFHEEHSFRSASCPSPLLQSRARYLSSNEFLKRDKLILQKAILKRIIADFRTEFGEHPILSAIDLNRDDVQTIVDTLLQSAEQEWVLTRLQLGGLLYEPYKLAKPLKEVPIFENPIINLKVRNKITHCVINDYQSWSHYVRLFHGETQSEIPASLLIKILAHPAMKPLSVILILMGISGLIFGGAGLLGIFISLSSLSSTILSSVSIATIVLGNIGFFSSSKETKRPTITIEENRSMLPNFN